MSKEHDRRLPTLELLQQMTGMTELEAQQILHEATATNQVRRERHAADHQLDEQARWHYLLERLGAHEAQLLRLLTTHPDVGTLAGIVSDGTLMPAQFVWLGSRIELSFEIADWPSEYEALYRKAKDSAKQLDQLLVLGLVGHTCHHYLFPRSVLLGEPN